MKTLILAAIRCSLMFTAVTASLFSVQPAQAFTITLEQMGVNVVATGSGALNLTGLTFIGGQGFLGIPGLDPSPPLTIDAGTPGFVDSYIGFTGPSSFGSGGFTEASSSSGDAVGIIASNDLNLFVRQGYVSGNPLSSSATWNNATFASLGVTPGTYVWSWGTGPNQNFTLIIGGAGVPDGGSTVSLLGFGLLGLAALRRKLSC
jgi:VPDSG-CTERM motif